MTLHQSAIEKMSVLEETFNDEKTFKSTGTYKGKVSIWENYGKVRLYVPRNAYEQAGYIDLATGEIKPTRPGNYDTLKRALDIIQ